MDQFDKKYSQNKQLFGGEPLEIVKIAFEKGLINSTTLDLGCGQGRNALFLINNGVNVIGIDTSIVAINKIIEDIGSKNNFFIDNIDNFSKYKFRNIIATFTLNFLGVKQKDFIKKLQENAQINDIHIIQDFIETQDIKRNFLTFDEITNLYHDWEILFLDQIEIKTLLMDKNGNNLFFNTYRIIARKNGL